MAIKLEDTLRGIVQLRDGLNDRAQGMLSDFKEGSGKLVSKDELEVRRIGMVPKQDGAASCSSDRKKARKLQQCRKHVLGRAQHRDVLCKLRCVPSGSALVGSRIERQ